MEIGNAHKQQKSHVVNVKASSVYDTTFKGNKSDKRH